MARPALSWKLIVLAFAMLLPASGFSNDAAIAGILERSFNLEVLAIPEQEQEVLDLFYRQRDFAPAWDRATAMQMGHLLRNGIKEGLVPAHYRAGLLDGLAQRFDHLSNRQRALVDILFSQMLLRFIQHLVVGDAVLVSENPGITSFQTARASNLVSIANQALGSRLVYESVFRYAPNHPFYARLKGALARYRAIEQNGGWPQIPKGPSLKKGMLDARVPLVRQRLLVSGDLPVSDEVNLYRYDALLMRAVKRFQGRFGLEIDGVVGPKTLFEMNVPVARRINQIRLNLERVRWLLGSEDKRFLLINIAGFKAYLIENGVVVWQARTQVGTPYRKTPVFRTKMKYLVFNPTWTVPPTIFREDILPRLQAGELDYLKERKIGVIDFDGNSFDAEAINWPEVDPLNWPFLLRQEPGPKNALGRVKFIFPNRYSVFLHDTPNKQLFDKSNRAFSSGCIRVERPFELVERLMDKKKDWSAGTLEQILESGETTTVHLSQQLVVQIAYWTTDVDDEGNVLFIPDLYGRDRVALNRLYNRMPLPVRRVADFSSSD